MFPRVFLHDILSVWLIYFLKLKQDVWINLLYWNDFIDWNEKKNYRIWFLPTSGISSSGISQSKIISVNWLLCYRFFHFLIKLLVLQLSFAIFDTCGLFNFQFNYWKSDRGKISVTHFIMYDDQAISDNIIKATTDICYNNIRFYFSSKLSHKRNFILDTFKMIKTKKVTGFFFPNI